LLEAGAGRDRDVDDLQFDGELVAQGLAMGWPAVGGGLQAVVDVDGTQGGRVVVAGVVSEKVQEDAGVEAAGEGDIPRGSVLPGGKAVGEVDHVCLTEKLGSLRDPDGINSDQRP
jgi:hypothetical protein